MPHLRDHRPALTVAVLAAGLWTLLASSTFEEGEPDTQARVSFAVSTSTTPISLEDGTVESIAMNLRVAGDYEDDLGDPITIQRDNLTVDVSTTFDLSVSAVDGEDDIASENIEFGTAFEVLLDIDQDPDQGQFSVNIDGTTTLLTVENDGFTIETTGNDTISRDFDDFRAAVEDEDEDEPDDVRLSAAAYAFVPLALQIARIAEDFADDIEFNAETLEGMNLNESLTLTCSNTGGERVIIWTQDASGTGEGEVGEGDSFELRVESCFDSQLNRFLDGVITLADYIPIDEDANERSFGATLDLAQLFISEQEVNVGTNASSTSPRVDGTVVVRYDEVELEVISDDEDTL
ncbi:MAG: hypothetical protein AAF184_19765 [Pseudomonadota bacterium]